MNEGMFVARLEYVLFLSHLLFWWRIHMHLCRHVGTQSGIISVMIGRQRHSTVRPQVPKTKTNRFDIQFLFDAM